ncbi:MAG: ABC transporter ATP-binding protein [Hyphomicrobiales bacterium]
MKGLFKIFFGIPGTRPWLLVGCLLLSSLFDAVGVGVLLPILSQLSGTTRENPTALERFVNGLFEFIGFTPSGGTLVAVLALTLAIKAGLSFFAMSYVAKSVARVTALFRSRMLKALLEAKWNYFVAFQPGAISNAISTQAISAGDAYQASALVVANSIRTVTLGIIAIFISGRLALWGFAAALLLVLPLQALVRLTRRASLRSVKRQVRLLSYVQDAISNIKPLKSMDRQAAFAERFAQNVAKLEQLQIKRTLSRYGLRYGQEAIVASAICVALFLGGSVLKAPLPELLVIGFVFFQVIETVKSLQSTLQTLADAEPAYSKFLELLEEAESASEPPGGRLVPVLERSIRFDDVSFSHVRSESGERLRVLDGVSFDCPAGGITVLIGSSGAGKTTIIDLLIGLHQPQSGQILIDDVPLASLSLKTWRRMIGYVPQELSLLQGSIYENVTLGDTTISREDVEEALRLAGAGEFLATLPEGLDTDAGVMGAKFSGGQRQRISLARALVSRPKVLILDEVTSALDAETEAEICRNIQDLSGRHTIISITHRPAWANIAQRIYRVGGGKVKPVQKAGKAAVTPS